MLANPGSQGSHAGDTDQLGSLPGDGSAGGALRLELDGPAASFCSSTVSTPYMLGLTAASPSHPSLGSVAAGPGGGGGGGVSHGAAGLPPPVALLSARSNVSDATHFAAPAWPIAWRSVLTLPPPVSATAAAAGAAGAGSGPGAPSGPGLAGASQSTPGRSRLAPHRTVTSLAGANGGAALPAGPSGTDSSSHALPSPTASLADLRSPSALGSAPLPATARAPAAAQHAQHGALVCSAPVALAALQQGDVLVLRGHVAEALRHYPRAHVYGFLPSLLVSPALVARRTRMMC